MGRNPENFEFFLNYLEDQQSVQANEILGALDPLEGDDATKFITYQDFLSQETEDIPFENYFDLSRVPAEFQVGLMSILQEHSSIFMTKGQKLGVTDLVDFKIELLEGATPVTRPPIRCPIQFQKQYDEAIEDMVRDGIITEGESSWASPIVPVRRKKADGTVSLRLACDLRIPNYYTKSFNVPLPIIGELLAGIPLMAGIDKPVIFSSLDLKSAYWQIKINDQLTREVLSVVTTTKQYLLNTFAAEAKWPKTPK